MNTVQLVQHILQSAVKQAPKEKGFAYAPVNIALSKYWGKRDSVLNLPATSSFSIALPEKGAFTTIALTDVADTLLLNGLPVARESHFYQRIMRFLDLFRPSPSTFFSVTTTLNIPDSSGLASSACGFAALVLALNDLWGWMLSDKSLSILARVGSGSAARSLWPGFVHWHRGERVDGMDSYTEPLQEQWLDLRIGLCLCDNKPKSWASREAMEISRLTSPYYTTWLDYAEKDITRIQQAIRRKDFEALGQWVEQNALAMHAVMLSSWPPMSYATEKTVAAMRQIWDARQSGLPLFFTQDAGPHLKLLFPVEVTTQVMALFPTIEIVTPFCDPLASPQVILVDENDKSVGYTDKITAHQKALRHRAFSVFIFRERQGKKEVLLQRRHPDKYHCGNLWTNTCCSHPQPGESVIQAGERRLQQEMGLSVRLAWKGRFHYVAPFDNGLTENEVDHVLVGEVDVAVVSPDPTEVSDVAWVEVDDLNQRLQQFPTQYTPWLKQALSIAIREEITYDEYESATC